jgi:hypothetical protein
MPCYLFQLHCNLKLLLQRFLNVPSACILLYLRGYKMHIQSNKCGYTIHFYIIIICQCLQHPSFCLFSNKMQLLNGTVTPPRSISFVSVEPVSDVSETASVSIIRSWYDECYIGTVYLCIKLFSGRRNRPEFNINNIQNSVRTSQKTYFVSITGYCCQGK